MTELRVSIKRSDLDPDSFGRFAPRKQSFLWARLPRDGWFIWVCTQRHVSRQYAHMT